MNTASGINERIGPTDVCTLADIPTKTLKILFRWLHWQDMCADDWDAESADLLCGLQIAGGTADYGAEDR